MAGNLSSWPSWPEFTPENGEPGDDLAMYKAAIKHEYGQDNLEKSWIKVCHKLEDITREIKEKGSSIIPEIQFKDLSSLTMEQKQKFRDIGCFVIKGVIDREQADQWFDDLKKYVSDNGENITGKQKFQLLFNKPILTTFRMAFGDSSYLEYVLFSNAGRSSVSPQFYRGCP